MHLNVDLGPISQKVRTVKRNFFEIKTQTKRQIRSVRQSCK